MNLLHMFPREQVTRSVTKTISFGLSGMTSITLRVYGWRNLEGDRKRQEANIVIFFTSCFSRYIKSSLYGLSSGVK